MSENFNENQNTELTSEHQKIKSCECNHHQNWGKCFFILLAAFLGGFLAVYFVVDQAVKQIFLASPQVHNEKIMQKMLKEQDRLMKDFDKSFNKEIKTFGQIPPLKQINPISDIAEVDDAYIIWINLKPFGGNPENLKINIEPKKVFINGNMETKDKNSTHSVSYSQIFTLDERVNPLKVTKEKKYDKYILTIPFSDRD